MPVFFCQWFFSLIFFQGGEWPNFGFFLDKYKNKFIVAWCFGVFIHLQNSVLFFEVGFPRDVVLYSPAELRGCLSR